MLHDTDRHQFDDTADKVDLPNVVPTRADVAQDQQPAPVKKTRKPPKPGPAQRRPDEPHRIPLNVGLQATDKMRMLRVIARDHRLTAAQKAVAIPLVDLVHSAKGHSFASWQTLGDESGFGWQAAKGAANKLKVLGYVNIDHVQGGVVHMSLNLEKIDTPKPERKRTLSRDEAREKAAAKNAGKEMSDQTSPSQRHDMPKATEASGISYQSQRHVSPVGMCSETSPGMCGPTSGEMYGVTSGEMYGQTSKSEIPLGEVIQRAPLGERKEQNEGCAAAAPPDRPRGSDDLEKKPSGWDAPDWDDEYHEFASRFPGNTMNDLYQGAFAGIRKRGFTLDEVLVALEHDLKVGNPDGALRCIASFFGRYFGESAKREDVQHWRKALEEARVKAEHVQAMRFAKPKAPKATMEVVTKRPAEAPVKAEQTEPTGSSSFDAPAKLWDYWPTDDDLPG